MTTLKCSVHIALYPISLPFSSLSFSSFEQVSFLLLTAYRQDPGLDPDLRGSRQTWLQDFDIFLQNGIRWCRWNRDIFLLLSLMNLGLVPSGVQSMSVSSPEEITFYIIISRLYRLHIVSWEAIHPVLICILQLQHSIFYQK